MKSLLSELTGKKRIGLFGGTFDPVHYGHLIIAETVREQANLDVVLFIPSSQPPHKENHELMFDTEQRIRMLSDAIKDNPFFAVSDIELSRKGTSYTIDTIREIKAYMPPETEFPFIVGKDNLYDLETWKEPQSIIEECSILAADRICDEKHDIPEWLKTKVEMVNAPLIEISSSDIRKRIIEGKSIRYLVPEMVADIIEKVIESQR